MQSMPRQFAIYPPHGAAHTHTGHDVPHNYCLCRVSGMGMDGVAVRCECMCVFLFFLMRWKQAFDFRDTAWIRVHPCEFRVLEPRNVMWCKDGWSDSQLTSQWALLIWPNPTSVVSSFDFVHRMRSAHTIDVTRTNAVTRDFSRTWTVLDISK